MKLVASTNQGKRIPNKKNVMLVFMTEPWNKWICYELDLKGICSYKKQNKPLRKNSEACINSLHSFQYDDQCLMFDCQSHVDDAELTLTF